jgi:hypothetical protein
MTVHSSSIDSDLTAEVSRKNIFAVFERVGGKRNGANVDLPTWIKVREREGEKERDPNGTIAQSHF